MHNRKLILISSLILLAYFIIGFTYFCKEKISIELNGNAKIELNIGDEYKELGARASICKKSNCHDISKEIKISGKLNTSEIGNYEIVYELNYNNQKYEIKRDVKVVDNESPIIKLIGNDEVNVCPNKDYVEEGYEAIDNLDGDVTKNVEIIKEDNSIKYVVKDSSGNVNTVIRKINYIDNEKPVIELDGSKIINLSLNDKYVEYGVVVNDNCSQLDDVDVKIDSNVDTSKEGTYKVIYTVEDESGNKASVTRTVKVIKDVIFNTNNKKDYIRNLENYIKDKNYNVSLGYVNLNTGYTYLYNQNVVYYGASLVKTVDALYVYEKMNFNENVRKKVEKAISVSDNTSHIELVDMIGINNLRSYGRSLGAKDFLTRSNNDYFGNTTVKDQIAVWKYLYQFVNNNSKGKELRQYFINSYCNYLLFDGIPTTMHKYGYYDIYYHDVGIVYADDPYIVVILTKHGNDNFKSIVQDLSKKIYGLNMIDN